MERRKAAAGEGARSQSDPNATPGGGSAGPYGH